MSYQEKRVIVNIIGTILICAIYFPYVALQYPDADPYSKEIFHFWGLVILILIPVSIVAKIIIYIVFSIINTITTQEKEPSIVDERDRLIELKATQIYFSVFVAGFLLAMASLVINQPPSMMFILLIAAGTLAEILGDISQFYFYWRGV